MDLALPPDHAVAAVGLVRCNEAVTPPCCVAPAKFELLPPTSIRKFVKIERETHIDVSRHERQRCITCVIKSPRVDCDLMDDGPAIS